MPNYFIYYDKTLNFIVLYVEWMFFCPCPVSVALHITARQYGEVVLPDASIRQLSWYPASAGPRNCPGARRVWRTFCRPGTNFIEHYACRGTSLIGAGKLSRYRMIVRSTCAVSRYKLSRSQKSVTVQDFNCGQMSVSGCNRNYKFVLRAGAEQKV